MGESGNRHRSCFPETHPAVCVGAGVIALPGFIKELRYVAAYQNPQQAMYGLRETVLKNSMTKQSQQAMGALAVGGLLLLALVAMTKGS